MLINRYLLDCGWGRISFKEKVSLDLKILIRISITFLGPWLEATECALLVHEHYPGLLAFE